jgi:hypothetical protein
MKNPQKARKKCTRFGEDAHLRGTLPLSMNNERTAPGGIEEAFTNHFRGLQISEVRLAKIKAQGAEMKFCAEVVEGRQAGLSSVIGHNDKLLLPIGYHDREAYGCVVASL